MAYYGRRISSHRNRFKDQRREFFLRTSGLITLFFLLVLISLIYISRLDRFQIESINTEGNSITSSSDINSITNKNLSGFYFKMFPRRNSLIYPRRKIERELLEEFRRIKAIDVSVNDFKNLKISITERKPDSLWCGSSLENSTKDCYFIDDEGFIYSKAPNFSGNVFLINYGEIGGAENPVGEFFLESLKFQSLKSFIEVLDQNNLEAIFVQKLSDGDLEIYLESGGKFVYGLDQDVEKLSNDLVSVLKDEEFQSDLHGGELDYIDLRFGNKVYFKFK